MAVPSGWTDVNGVITAPNGHTVLFGDAEFIRTHPWEADNVPLDGGEQYMSSVLAQDARWGPGSRRVFKRCFLVYPTAPTVPGLAAKMVYRIDTLGAEVLAAEAQAAHLAQQNNQLTQQVATLTQQLAALSADEAKDEATITDLTTKVQQAGPAAEEISQIEKILGTVSTTTPTVMVVDKTQ